MNLDSNKLKVNSNNQIDLLQIAKILFKKKYTYCITMGAAVVVGSIVAFSIPKMYKTEVVLAPELTSSSSVSSSLSDIASMVGVNFKSVGSSYDAIYPEIYPQIISSTPFLTSMFNVRVSSCDSIIKDVSLYNYLNTKQKVTWWDSIKIFVIRIFKKKKKGKGNHVLDNFNLSESEFETAKAIRGLIGCSVDKKTSIITLSFMAQDPYISACVADTIQQKLQDYITLYRTKKARIDLDYALSLYDKAKKQYEEAQQKFADFADSNENLILESYKVKRDNLENEMQLQFNIYNQIAQQVQMARAKIQEKTPAFTQIQPATVPLKKDSPKRMTIIVAYALFAFIVTTIYILIKDSKNKRNQKL